MPGGARPDTRAATLAANPYTSSWAVSRYTSPRCTPTRTLMPTPNRRCAASLSRATWWVISKPASTARRASSSWAVG